METTRNKLTDDEYMFFKNLSGYLETQIYFYGSVQRPDYFPGRSDIDIDIFTDNETATLSKLQHHLHIPKEKFKSFVGKLNNNRIVKGTKVMYKSQDEEFSAEISIYNEKYKDIVLYEHQSKSSLPFYITFCLVILKFLYYDLHLFPIEYYSPVKKWLLSYGIQLTNSDFLVLGKKYSK